MRLMITLPDQAEFDPPVQTGKGASHPGWTFAYSVKHGAGQVEGSSHVINSVTPKRMRWLGDAGIFNHLPNEHGHDNRWACNDAAARSIGLAI